MAGVNFGSEEAAAWGLLSSLATSLERTQSARPAQAELELDEDVVGRLDLKLY